MEISEDYDPRYDEEEMNAFIKEGTKVWKDVPDAAEWVRKLRDGELE